MRFLALHRDAKIGETDPLIGLQPVEACVVKPCWLLKKKKKKTLALFSRVNFFSHSAIDNKIFLVFSSSFLSSIAERLTDSPVETWP